MPLTISIRDNRWARCWPVASFHIAVITTRKHNGKPGRKPTSRYTPCGDGRNEKVVTEIKALLKQPSIDYGLIKVTWWLRYNKRYLINFKKVYRFMAEHHLLNPVRCKSRFPRNWASWDGTDLQGPLCYWQFDFKYVYMAGQRKNALLLSVLDVDSRLVLGTVLRWSVCKEQVRDLFADILSRYSLSLPELVTVRSDNGSQFVAELNLTQEYTRPATPQQNWHVEAWHSIVERTICQRLKLNDLPHGQTTVKEFADFYNNERIHSEIGYKSPKQYLMEKGIDLYQANDETELQCELSKVEYLSR